MAASRVHEEVRKDVLADALPHVRESIRLNPNDPQSHEFLAFIEKQ